MVTYWPALNKNESLRALGIAKLIKTELGVSCFTSEIVNL
jgi:hypothetical protein